MKHLFSHLYNECLLALVHIWQFFDLGKIKHKFMYFNRLIVRNDSLSPTIQADMNFIALVHKIVTYTRRCNKIARS